MDKAYQARSRETLRLEIESIKARLEELFLEIALMTIESFRANRNLPIDINILCETYDELSGHLDVRQRQAESLQIQQMDPALMEAFRLETNALETRLDGVMRELGKQAINDYCSSRSLPRDISLLCETYTALHQSMEQKEQQLAEIFAAAEEVPMLTFEPAPSAASVQHITMATSEPQPLVQHITIPKSEPPPAVQHITLPPSGPAPPAPPAPAPAPPRETQPPMPMIMPPVMMMGKPAPSSNPWAKLFIPLFIVVSIGLVVLGLHLFGQNISAPKETNFDGSLIYYEKNEPTMQVEAVDAWKVLGRLDKIREGESVRTAKSPITVVKLIESSVRLGPDTIVRFTSLRRSDNFESSMVKLEVPYGRVWIDKSSSMKLMVETSKVLLNAAELSTELKVDRNGDMMVVAWKGGGSIVKREDNKTYKFEEGSYITFKASSGAIDVFNLNREKQDNWQAWNLKCTIDEIYNCSVPNVEDMRKR